jgi:hypothetical protein
MLMMTGIDDSVNKMTREAFNFFIHDDVIFSLDPA